MMALVPPPAALPTKAVIRDLPPHMMSATFKTEVASLAPGQEVTIPYVLYFGPKDRGILATVGHGLERAVDFGWFQILALPLLYVLKFFYSFLRNYGWAIIALTFGYPGALYLSQPQKLQIHAGYAEAAAQDSKITGKV